ncbi:hypothetical protein Q3G72_005260 [Acer saccharum]|nr:hypothetical protein Q3G72_005260 [Acer saccharum]
MISVLEWYLKSTWPSRIVLALSSTSRRRLNEFLGQLSCQSALEAASFLVECLLNSRHLDLVFAHGGCDPNARARFLLVVARRIGIYLLGAGLVEKSLTKVSSVGVESVLEGFNGSGRMWESRPDSVMDPFQNMVSFPFLSLLQNFAIHFRQGQVVKEIQATLKTELHDIRTKVNLLHAKFSLTEDKNLDKDLHNTSSHQNSMHNMLLNLPPPPPSSRPLSIPTRQHPTVELPIAYDIKHVTNIFSHLHTQYTVFTIANGKQYSLKKSLSRLRESYMYDLRRCEKPLDIVFVDDIVVAFPTTFSFKKFTISDAKPPSQPNSYDCGLLLCMFMDDNCPTPLQMESSLLLARFLALFLGNSNILSLKKNAQEHYNKLVFNNEVVPLVKIRAPHIQKLRVKAAALME